MADEDDCSSSATLVRPSPWTSVWSAGMVVAWSAGFLFSPSLLMVLVLLALVAISLGAFVASRVNEVRFDDQRLEVRVFGKGTVAFDRARLVSLHQRFAPPFGPTIEVFHLDRQQPGRRRTVGVSIGLYRRRDRDRLRAVLAGPPAVDPLHSSRA